MKRLQAAVLAFTLTSFAFGQVRLPSVIGSHMVLQQMSEVPLWGWAKPGESVTVLTSWDGRVVTCKADAEGKWRVNVTTPTAGGPYSIKISAKNKIHLEDILIGEVWLCSGQSNMEMPLRGWPEYGDLINDSDAEIEAANYPEIRLFTVFRKTSFEPQEECSGSWSTCTPETAATFSATGYFFGKELHKELQVPIGLIHSSWGGTAAEAWTSNEFISRIPYFTTEPGHLDAEVFLGRKLDQYRKDLSGWASTLGFSPDQPAPAWALAPKADLSWLDTEVPASWGNSNIGDYTGVVDYHLTFTVPKGWIKKELVLELGPIDEMDVTMVNGVVVGKHLMPSDWAKPRVYDIPPGTLHAGDNVLAVRVANTSGVGGINGKPEVMKIRPKKSKAIYQPLAGTWQARKSASYESVPAPPGCVGCDLPNTPTTLYNGMIHPIIPFGIRGAIWYQGESNRYDGELYKQIFPGMIANWRHDWQQGDFPFYFVQIAPYTYRDNFSTGLLREAQDEAWRTVPNTGMVVTMDIGNVRNIHPGNKQEVGRRLALWALARDYDVQGMVATAPVYRSWQKEGNKIRISFDLHGQQLVAGDAAPKHFRIAGIDHKFVDASAVIDNGTILVEADGVAEPAAVRFAWESTDEPNLFGSSGLPVGPFRTDQWKD
ncbi:MAG: sialate O-acetylesterase [Bacteroidales bacterium]